MLALAVGCGDDATSPDARIEALDGGLPDAPPAPVIDAAPGIDATQPDAAQPDAAPEET
jgi:hypothetical protein